MFVFSFSLVFSVLNPHQRLCLLIFLERGKKGERETKRGRDTERNRETETLGVTLQAAELPGQGCALGGFQIFFFSILKFQNDIP